MDKGAAEKQNKTQYNCRKEDFFLRKEKATFRKWKRGQMALEEYREIPWPGGLGLNDL